MVIRMVIRMVSRMVIRMVSRMVILWLYGVLEGPQSLRDVTKDSCVEVVLGPDFPPGRSFGSKR